MAVKSVTNDELSHLPAGLAAVATGELRLNPEHPPLVKWLAGAAGATLDPELPLDAAAYREANQWAFGRATLFESGNDHRALLFRGRLPVVALSVLGGLGVFLWSRRRFGAAGGLLSLALHAFSPTVLAHGRLVTMDAAVAAGAVWTLYLGWLAVRTARPSDGLRALRDGLFGLALGLTLGAKFSGLLLLPALALADLATAGVTFRAAWHRRVLRWAVAGGAAALVVQALYLFPADPLRYLHDLRGLYAENDPDALYYLGGRFRSDGFPEYFLAALAVKTSVAGLVAMAAGLALAVRRALPGADGEDRRDDLWLWLPAALWIAAHSAWALDLGVRYLLPVYPLLFVLAGAVPRAVVRLRSARGQKPALAAGAVVLVLGGAQLATAAAAWPDYLPFFNRPARALAEARGGVPWLDDSNLDWGQDLARLAPWLESKGIGRVRLLYYGAGVPEAYGVAREPMLPDDWWHSPRPGDYVVSAQYLVRGLHTARTEGAPTDWLLRHRPAGVLGGTLYLYRFAPSAPAAGAGPTPEGEREEAEAAGGRAGEGEAERPALDP